MSSTECQQIHAKIKGSNPFKPEKDQLITNRMICEITELKENDYDNYDLALVFR